MSSTGPHNEAGFSLIEMLAVLAILAVVTGVAVLSLRGPQEDTPRDRIRALTADLSTETRQSLYDGQTRALALSQDGWELRRFDTTEWVTDRTGGLTGRVSLVVEDVPVELTEELLPLILFEPSGLATPFVLEAGQRRERFVLTGDATGELSVELSGDR